MKSRVAALVAIGIFGVVALWWVFVYSPRGGELSDTRDEVTRAQEERTGLDSTLKRLQAIDDDGPATDARLQQLSEALPSTPDLAGFITGAHEIAEDAGIDWISVAPAEPTATPGAPPTIRLSIQIEGGFFQVLDYMNRLEDLDRLVIVDSVNITTGATGGGGGDTSTTTAASTGGAPDLAVTLTARMFTLSTPGSTATTVPAGTSQTTAAPGATTTVAGATTTTQAAN